MTKFADNYRKNAMTTKSSIDRKSIFINLLKNQKVDRFELRFKMLDSLINQKVIDEPKSQEEYDKVMTTNRNSIDTLVSKARRNLIEGYKINQSGSKLSLTEVK